MDLLELMPCMLEGMLALLPFDPNDFTGNLECLKLIRIKVLHDWEFKFMECVKVGQPVSDKTTVKELHQCNEEGFQK